LKMMRQEARQIPVTIAVMKVNGVAVRTPIERTRKGEKMIDPAVTYLMAKPFVWIMRGAYKIQLKIDGNSQYLLGTFDEMRDIEDDVYGPEFVKMFRTEYEQYLKTERLARQK
jgi:hypothetical protein